MYKILRKKFKLPSHPHGCRRAKCGEKALAGQFIILKVDEQGERIPSLSRIMTGTRVQ